MRNTRCGMPVAAQRQPLAIYAITRHGVELARRLGAALPDAHTYVSDKFLAQAPPGARPLARPMGPALQANFTTYDCHVFIISVGAVVRMIAPLLQNKKIDPAVVCVDDAGQWAICVLSGHVGRGNAFTERVAAALGAQPIITTASDVRGTLTVDILGRQLGWTLDDPDRNITRGCAAVVNEAPVMFIQETGEPDWWPADTPLPRGISYTRSLDAVNPDQFEILLIVTDRDLRATHPRHFERAVIYRPRSLVLGLGCDKATAPALVERGVRTLLQEHHLSLACVRSAATIDLKKDEPALAALCEKYRWPLQTYAARQLDAAVGVENPSATVKKYVGTRTVAEAAALLASGSSRLLVPKQTYTEPGAGRSMTLAVARIPFPEREVWHA